VALADLDPETARTMPDGADDALRLVVARVEQRRLVRPRQRERADEAGMRSDVDEGRTRPEDAARVVFLTGGALTAEIADFLATVPNLHLEKPFGVLRLRATVQQILAAQA